MSSNNNPNNKLVPRARAWELLFTSAPRPLPVLVMLPQALLGCVLKARVTEVVAAAVALVGVRSRRPLAHHHPLPLAHPLPPPHHHHLPRFHHRLLDFSLLHELQKRISHLRCLILHAIPDYFSNRFDPSQDHHLHPLPLPHQVATTTCTLTEEMRATPLPLRPLMVTTAFSIVFAASPGVFQADEATTPPLKLTRATSMLELV